MSTMKFDLIPHSSAKNSYDLLSDVIKAIDEEPRRFNWSTWFNGDLSAYEPARIPACGTLACIAGWTNLLTASTAVQDFEGNGVEKWFPAAVQGDLSALFYANFGNPETALVPFDNYMPRARKETQRDYADRGIRAIEAFQRKHACVLQAHTIDIPARQGGCA